MDTHHPDAFDIVIVGNGIIGLAIAIELKTRNPDGSVAVIGPSGRAGGATAAAGAMFGCHGEVTERTATPLGTLRFRMAEAGRAAWRKWLPRLREHAGADWPTMARNTHVILNSISGPMEDRNFAAIEKSAIDSAISVNPADLPLKPIPNQRPLRAATLVGEEGIDARGLLRILERFALSLGIALIDGRATLEPKSGSRFAVRLEGGERSKPIMADKLVIAAGARSTALLEEAFPETAARIPAIFSGVGQALILDPRNAITEEMMPRDVVRTPNRAFACGLHVVPQNDGRLYVGATNFVAAEPATQPYLCDVHFLMQCVLQQINVDLEGARCEAMLTGNRPVSLDGQPVVGATGVPGLFICTGTYRDGVQVAPLLADCVAAAVTGVAPDTDLGRRILEAFVPERALISWGDREQAIRYGTEHFLADTSENGTLLPLNNWDRRLEQGVRGVVQDLVGRYSCDHWTIPPDFLPALYGVNGSMAPRLADAIKRNRTAWSMPAA